MEIGITDVDLVTHNVSTSGLLYSMAKSATVIGLWRVHDFDLFESLFELVGDFESFVDTSVFR